MNILYRFTALQDFDSAETRSHYVAGLSYAARSDDRVLLELLPQWLDEGLVKEGGPVAVVTGRG
jgi:hypothetical protein